jgi:CHAT domain-containing protein
MSGKVIFIPLSFLLICSFNPHPPGGPAFNMIVSAYNKANEIFNKPNTTPREDSLCMKAFGEIITDLTRLPRSRFSDSLLYQSNYKLGVLYEIYKDYPKATASYLKAIVFSTRPGEKFMNSVLAGAAYYNQNNFDSASYFLLRAAESPEETGTKEDRIRLYNTLGVLFYDNGNYLQSKNYFGQALRLIDSKNLTDKYSLQINIAACYFKLGLYEQALSIYKKVLNFKPLNTALHMNMGRTYRALHQYESAMVFFNKVNTSVAPNVLNEKARTELEAGNPVKASEWLDKYKSEKRYIPTNELDDGENELYSADLDIYNRLPESALRHLQDALIIFSKNFTDRDTRNNPHTFTGSFAYYRLFEVMDKKATAWEKLYEKTKLPEDLKSAFDTYQSTISLLSYIERSYEMDDAKILLKQKSGNIFTRALKVCLRLERLYPESGYLESAFLISEKNKASVMSSQIRERSISMSVGSENKFETEERNIKFNIARLNSRADESMGADALQKLNEEKSAFETQLVSLHRKMESNSRYYQLKYSDDFPSIHQMQTALENDQAVISIYNTLEEVEIFVLTKTGLTHAELDSGIAIRKNLQKWVQILQSAETGTHSHLNVLKKEILSQLIKPILTLAGNKEEWIVIPDGLFFQVPIESLPVDEHGKMVIENHIVGYEFSARFIPEKSHSYEGLLVKENALSFAPFSGSGAKLQGEGMETLQKLPFSKDEISILDGTHYLDRMATKSVFVKNSNRYPIIHLATHAITDLDNPSASFIAFYPSAGDRSDDFLFLDEIYSLNMDSCRMIAISACETGRGELVNNEGVMSFARAFLYAGCPSTINTLWKADDRSTAEIMKLFYKNLYAGEKKSVALQQAKLEFIRNNPLYKDPSYWAHIILTGDPGALYKKKQPWIWAVFAICCVSILIYLIRRQKITQTIFQATNEI